MRTTKFTVILTESERAHLRTLIGQGTAPARRLTHVALDLDRPTCEAAILSRLAATP